MNSKLLNNKYFHIVILFSIITLSLIAKDNSILKISEFTEPFEQNEKWEAPKKADRLINPLKDISTASSKGKDIFDTQCVICHGERGLGDGIAGMSLTPRPTNLTSKEVQKQSDGAIFWKISTGKSPMASYKNVYTDEQRWQLITYIRTLAEKNN